MAARHGPVTIPTALGRFEGLVPQDGWHRYGTPRCRGRGLRTLARAHGLEGGLTTTRRRWARPSALRAPHGGGRPQAGAPRGHIPARAASGGRDGGVAEAFGPSLEAHRLPRGGLPGTQLGYDRGSGPGASCPRLASRGRPGASREPDGARGQGHHWPLRNGAWRPRRLRSAIRVRSSAATALRLCQRHGAWGASRRGRSTNATRQPRGVRASTTSIWGP